MTVNITEIASVLKTGKDNAISGRVLCDMLGLTPRELTLKVERERKAGAPICANTSGTPGYYIAADKEEMRDFCGRLKHRINELEKTREACARAVEWLSAAQDQSGGECCEE